MKTSISLIPEHVFEFLPLLTHRISCQSVPANLQTSPRCDATPSCLFHPRLEVNWTDGGSLRLCLQQTPTSGQQCPERKQRSFLWFPAFPRMSICHGGGLHRLLPGRLRGINLSAWSFKPVRLLHSKPLLSLSQKRLPCRNEALSFV